MASVQNNRLLFLAVEYVKLGRTFPEPNYLLYCVDLTTGRRLKGGEMLSALGLDDARFGAQAHLAAMDTCRQNYNALCMEMNGSYPTEDDSGLLSLLENTMLRNQSTELVGRGVFVDGSGNLYALAYIDDVSAYGGKWMLVRVLM